MRPPALFPGMADAAMRNLRRTSPEFPAGNPGVGD